MKRFFTLVLTFCIGVVIGAAFFSEDAVQQAAPGVDREALAQSLSGILGTSKEVASSIMEDIKPVLNQMSTLSDEQLQSYFSSLAQKYNIPSLTSGQLDGLLSLYHSLTQLDLETIQGAAQKTGESVSNGVRIVRAVQRIVHVTAGFIETLQGAIQQQQQ